MDSVARTVHPLPKGEGRGEGKQTTARRSRNVLGLSCGRGPQGYLALNHSRFQASSFAGVSNFANPVQYRQTAMPPERPYGTDTLVSNGGEFLWVRSGCAEPEEPSRPADSGQMDESPSVAGQCCTTFLQTFDGRLTTFVSRWPRLETMKTTFLSLVLAVAPWSVFAGNEAIENYVAHEWGTFTSVQGADGVLLPWNPLESTQLPKFVHDWNKPGLDRRPAGALNRDTKSVFVTLQRMETPVIYFYSDAERTVDVTVRFPQGLITEWYPQAHDVGPSAFPPNKLATALDGFAQQAGLSPRITL